jgi:hypothetical protein
VLSLPQAPVALEKPAKAPLGPQHPEQIGHIVSRILGGRQ